MFESLVQSFLQSSQGQSAAQTLEQQGVPAGQTQGLLSALLPAASGVLQTQAATKSSEPALGMFDLLGGHSGQAFLIGAATTLVQGGGITGALENGAIGLVAGHLGEVAASHLGVDRATGARISAAAAPFIVSYIHEHVSGHPDVVAKHGATDGNLLQQKKAELTAIAAKNAAAGWKPKPL